ncbi:hypothetical protein U1Q18_009777, partial [Sarracenia purpurea var. burkii]
MDKTQPKWVVSRNKAQSKSASSSRTKYGTNRFGVFSSPLDLGDYEEGFPPLAGKISKVLIPQKETTVSVSKVTKALTEEEDPLGRMIDDAWKVISPSKDSLTDEDCDKVEGRFEKLAIQALGKAKRGQSPLNEIELGKVIEWLAWYRGSPCSKELCKELKFGDSKEGKVGKSTAKKENEGHVSVSGRVEEAMSNVSPEANDVKRKLEVDSSNVLVKDSEASILEGVNEAGVVTPSDSKNVEATSSEAETEREGEVSDAVSNVDQGKSRLDSGLGKPDFSCVIDSNCGHDMDPLRLKGQAPNLQATFLAHNVFEELSQPYTEATMGRGEVDPKDSEVLDTNHIDGVNLDEVQDNERLSHTQPQAWTEGLFRDPVANQSFGKPSWADVAGNRDKFNNPNQPRSRGLTSKCDQTEVPDPTKGEAPKIVQASASPPARERSSSPSPVAKREIENVEGTEAIGIHVQSGAIPLSVEDNGSTVVDEVSVSEEETDVYDEATEAVFERLALDALDKARQGRSPISKDDLATVVEWLAWYRNTSPQASPEASKQVIKAEVCGEDVLSSLNEDVQ